MLYLAQCNINGSASIFHEINTNKFILKIWLHSGKKILKTANKYKRILKTFKRYQKKYNLY